MREQEIIEALRRREEAGMDALLLHYRPLMQYIIAPILQNPQDREDCLSEVSLRIWERFGNTLPGAMMRITLWWKPRMLVATAL